MYTEELMSKVKEFWYIFDERYTYYGSGSEVENLYLNCNLLIANPVRNSIKYNFDWIFFRLQDKIRIDPINYEDLFLKEIITYKAGIVALATDQIGIIESNLNPNEIEEAFEIFGQGVIYDARRLSNKVVEFPYYGYQIPVTASCKVLSEIY